MPHAFAVPDSVAWIARAGEILAAYRTRLGVDLVPRSGDAAEDARRLFELPRAVLAHDAQASPRLDWANRAAGVAFDAAPDRLVGLPSVETAPPDAIADRRRLFDALARRGFVTGYSGVRISRTGRRFVIEDVTIFPVADAAGRPAGHAAVIGSTSPAAE